jgi:adenylate cyclase
MGDGESRFNPNITMVMVGVQSDIRLESLAPGLVESDPNRRGVEDIARPAPAAPQEPAPVRPLDVAQLAASGESFGRAFRWLVTEARQIPDVVDVVAGLCRELIAGGMPLQRLYLAQRTLHPQMAAIGYLWNRGDTAAQVIAREHATLASATFLNSPMRRVYEFGESLLRRRLTGPDAVVDFPVLEELRDGGATDYAIFAMEVAGEPHGALSISTNVPGGFSDREIAGIAGLMPSLSTLVESREWHRTAKSLLEIYLGADAGRQVLGGSVRRGEGTTIAAAIWFCDLRDFTAMSNQLPRDEVIGLLNDYFDAMARPVHAHGGEILKFIGDAMLAIFPMRDDLDRDLKCQIALQAALEAFDAMDGLNEIRASAGKPPLRVGIGLHAGSVSYGNIGAAIGNSARLDFTAIGPAVNLASRIQGLCRGLNRPLLASRVFASPCGSKLVSLGRFPLHGFPEPQEIFGLPDD